MPVPPAVSCASDRASAPRLATVQKRREVAHCFCQRRKCAYGGGWHCTCFSEQKSNATERAQGLPVSRRRQRHLLPFPCVLPQGFCSLRNYKTGGFSFCVCVVCAGKVENSFSRGFIYGGSFPDSFDSAQQREGGGGLLRRQRHLLLPCALCRRVFARCGITKRTVFPVGNGGGVQNFRQKAKSWSKVRANCRNRAQNY